MIEVRAAARLLGGDVIGRDAVAAPGPGHSPRDRSLTVKFAAKGASCGAQVDHVALPKRSRRLACQSAMR